MSNMTTFILKPRIPGGGWITAFLAVVGIVMSVSSLMKPNLVIRVVGIILAVIGIILLLVILAGLRRRRVSVIVDDEGYTIEGPKGEYSGSWIDIADVLVSRESAKLALVLTSGRRTIIAHPARRMDDEFMRLRESIRDHLDETDSAD